MRPDPGPQAAPALAPAVPQSAPGAVRAARQQRRDRRPLHTAILPSHAVFNIASDGIDVIVPDGVSAGANGVVSAVAYTRRARIPVAYESVPRDRVVVAFSARCLSCRGRPRTVSSAPAFLCR